MTEPMSLGTTVLVLGLMALYALPMIVAGVRRHHNGLAIAVLTLLTGWTVIGWLLALVWASTAVQHKP